jgi:predicted alpha/beta superfamily hydrolase
MKAGRRNQKFVLPVLLFASVCLCYAILLAIVWNARTELMVRSEALGEVRKITVFGVLGGNAPNITIYALDGEKHRHALLPAAHSALISWVGGNTQPLFVAIHNQGRRDEDFRPSKVQPASWRPNIAGRSAAFDLFLLNEARSEIERRFGRSERRYLFGHSLAGFYALDMPTRQPQHGFNGIFAFSPTFSHDLSLLSRLTKVCRNTHIYANIGFESSRDTAVFDVAEKKFHGTAMCRGNVQLAHHVGIIHQFIMLTGQVAALRQILR